MACHLQHTLENSTRQSIHLRQELHQTILHRGFVTVVVSIFPYEDEFGDSLGHQGVDDFSLAVISLNKQSFHSPMNSRMA